MPKFYVLNLGFDLEEQSMVRGDFQAPPAHPTHCPVSKALTTSQVWLVSDKPLSDLVTTTDTLEAGSSTVDVIADGMITVKMGDHLSLRFFYTGSHPRASDLEVEYHLSFGRKEQASQRYRSPFSIPGIPRSKTSFHSPHRLDLGIDKTAIGLIGSPEKLFLPKDPNVTYGYGFIVTLSVYLKSTPNELYATFGLDPEMDVSMSGG